MDDLATATRELNITDENLDLEGGTTDEKLAKYLSFRTLVRPPPTAPCRQIGKGTQGVVFEEPGTKLCYKLQINPGTRNLWNNYIMQARVKEAFDRVAIDNPKLTSDIQCPGAKYWARADKPRFWDDKVDRIQYLPNVAHMRGQRHHCLAMERIEAVPEPLRRGLIGKYCEKEHQQEVKADLRNQDCLIRVLLGTEVELKSGRSKSAWLWNFPMDIVRFGAMKLPDDAAHYVESIAGAMAVLHWQANLDADDVEFVLGKQPYGPRVELTSKDFKNLPIGADTYDIVMRNQPCGREVCLSVLDFDRCKEISMDEKGVEQTMSVMERNYYCPRPGSGSAYMEGLWEVFYKRYLEVSEKLLPEGSKHLGQSFITKLKEHCVEKFKQQARDEAEGGDDGLENNEKE